MLSDQNLNGNKMTGEDLHCWQYQPWLQNCFQLLQLRCISACYFKKRIAFNTKGHANTNRGRVCRRQFYVDYIITNNK